MKKIIVLGGGESGVGAALLAHSKGFDTFLSDKGILSQEFKEKLIKNNIPFEENQHSEELILQADKIIISPGIPESNPLVQKILSKNIPIVSEIEFAAEFTKAKIIAITGSNGKTTTTLLTYHLLKEAGLNVGLGGNIGFSFAQMVIEDNYDYYVLEISSFQLDRCYNFAPDIAILTNITVDHLDRYNYQFENYAKAKFRIFQSQDKNQLAILWKEDPVSINYLDLVKAPVKYFSIQDPSQAAYITEDYILVGDCTIDQNILPIKGPHNAKNIAAAVLSAKYLGISNHQILEALPNFKNDPHRLEECGEWNSIKFINDSKATNVDSVFYALNSFKNNIILILGGVDKGNDYREIDDLVKTRVKTLVFMGTNNENLVNFYKNHSIAQYSTSSLKEAFDTVIKNAQPGDTVLLSPACASFDLFKNYQDRGNKFKELVKDFIHGKSN
ncbi:MAG: UDP-N-acetylmuramoyl-L-alanine--D-glutamate ligase [Bacteroidota bacterium]